MADFNEASHGRDRAPQRTALVLDDVPELASVVSELLRHFGWDSRPVSCWDSFLDAFTATPPALIILDLHMPDHDGAEVLQYLHEAAYSGQVCLVSGGPDYLLTALGNLAEGFGLPVCGQLSKPVSLADMAVVSERAAFRATG